MKKKYPQDVNVRQETLTSTILIQLETSASLANAVTEKERGQESGEKYLLIVDPLRCTRDAQSGERYNLWNFLATAHSILPPAVSHPLT